jgi:WD40 repeat protein
MRRLAVAGLLLLLVGLGVGFWSQRDGYRVLGQHTRHVTTLAFASDGMTLYSGCRERTGAGTAGKVWDVASARELHRFPCGEEVTLSSDGKLVATFDRANHEIRVWETGTGTERVTLRDVPTDLWLMDISRDGTMLATAGYRLKQDAIVPADTDLEEIELWDLTRGERSRDFGKWDKRVSGLSFAPDGKTLATCSDGTLQLWEVASGRELAAVRSERHGGRVGRMTFSPDGRYVAALAVPDIVVWEVETRALIATLPFAGYGPPCCLAFSPDGQFLAAGGDYIQWSDLFRGCRVVVWKVGSWREHSEVKGRLHGHRGDVVWSVAFSPDGSRLALGTARGYVGLVELER